MSAPHGELAAVRPDPHYPARSRPWRPLSGARLAEADLNETGSGS